MQNKPLSIKQKTCKLCGFMWFPRYPSVEPIRCPKCNSKFWHVGRQRAASVKGKSRNE